MRSSKQRRASESVAMLLDDVHCHCDGDTTSCEVDAMVQMGDVYVLLVPEIDEHDDESGKDELWPFIR